MKDFPNLLLLLRCSFVSLKCKKKEGRRQKESAKYTQREKTTTTTTKVENDEIKTVIFASYALDDTCR